MSDQSGDVADNPIERLELLAGDDEAIASFLDRIEVSGPRERQMLGELARTSTLADPERFSLAHRRVASALETLGRHGYHGSSAGAGAGAAKNLVRWLVQLVARYVVVSHLRQVALDLRNMYWLCEMETESLAPERAELRRARYDAEGLVDIFRRREIGLPSFVIGGLLIPVFATGWRLAEGAAFTSWWAAAITGLVTVLVVVGASWVILRGAALASRRIRLLVVVGASWVILRGAALASRRIRLSTRDALADLWQAVGNCGSPPKDHSRRFAIVAIALTVGGWVVLPAAVALTFAG